MIGKLRKKFIAAAIMAVSLVLAVLIGAINALNYRSLVADADGTLQILAENRGSFPGQMFREEDRPADLQPPPAEEWEDGPFGPIRGGYGELAYQSRYFTVWAAADGSLGRIDLENLASLTEEEAAALAARVYASGRERGFADGYRYRRAACDGETMLLFLNCQRELATFRDFLYVSTGIALAGTLAVFLLLLLFSGRIVRPIAESYAKQKQFITDAGHELKTPIAIIRADADVLQSELAEENEWVGDIHRQTDRLATLTADLVYLSRMEEENAALQTEELSLSELVDETALSFQSLARAKGKRFSAAVAPDLRVVGDPKALGKLVSILLDNAMKYSTEGGTVELELARAGRNARLIVRNSTPPRERGDADRLFERFAREDRSRSSESGGLGLGLAIAKAVTEAHRGRIHARSEDGASLTVTAELPLC
ncbi:MAG: HAMP domain-containing histidine kinase [Oscillospiraceae bacterium]|nr:HAMP domain-containing histidine kinase [Oscillospiraceae bacterium]